MAGFTANSNENMNQSFGASKASLGDSTELLSRTAADDAPKPAATAPPDGGTAAWLLFLHRWLDQQYVAPSFVRILQSIGSFEQYYMVGPLQGYSSSTIGWIPSLQIFFLFGLGPVVGIISDSYGPRPLIIAGTFLHVFGLMMASLATQYYQFILSQGVCSAIGVACLYTPGLACIPTWFSNKRGLAMGIVVTGASVGGVVFPIMIGRMIESIGYPWTIRTVAFIILILLTISIMTVQPRTKPVPKKMPAGRLAAPFTELPFALFLIGTFILTFGIFIPINFIAAQAYQEAHVSEEMSQYLVAVFNGASLFGRLTAGHLADKFGKWNIFALACLLSGVFEFALWIPAVRLSVAAGFSIAFGFASGAFIGLSGALPASVSPAPEIGYRMGMMFLAISIPALTIGPIGGAILESSANGWLDVKIFGGVMCFAGSAIIFTARLLYTDMKVLRLF